MFTNQNFFNFFIWWAVIGYSIWIGGTIFSISVVVPMWSESLPDSARTFFSETSFTKHIYNFFGPPWMVLRNLPLLLALFIGWKSFKHRFYLLVSSSILISAILFTVIYIYSINDELMLKAGINYSDDELTKMAIKWIWTDRIRFIVMASGYIFLLKAFKLPYPSSK